MITNRAEPKPPARFHPLAKSGLSAAARTSWTWAQIRALLTAALLATMFAACMPVTASARQESSSASKVQAEQQLALVNASKAAQDVDVGTFYMHKGDYGAASSRFEEAVQLNPKDAKARLLLAQCYEKQGDRTDAIKTYRDYLTVFPKASDQKKIRKKIAELTRKHN
jgi:Flp pilus assembly protein TadD